MTPGPEALLQGGRFHEAHAAFRQLLQRDAAAWLPRVGLARACLGMDDRQQAVAWLADACRVAPEQVQPLQLLADLLLEQKLYAQALSAYRQLTAALGQRGKANLLHEGFCREQLGDLDAAVGLYRAALEADPGFMEAHVDLAGVLWRVGDFEGALAHAQRAVALAPDHPYAVRMLGTTLLNLNRLDEAEAALRRALVLKPGFALAELDLAFTLLGAGRLAEGWSWYAQRWNDRDRLQRPAFYDARHEWAGPSQSLQGQRIAVYAEQGLGDAIQFVRWLPNLQRLGAQVVLVAPLELVALVEHSLPGVVCLTPERQLQVDLHAALLDLPQRLGVTLADLPGPVPYLRAPPDRVQAWRERLAPWAGVRRIGLAWCGNTAQVNNRNRAFALSDLAPLLGLPGTQWFSLQKSDPGGLRDVQPAEGALVDLTGEWTDFADSAAMLECLDLVITVDTSLAHLAGALGRPVWTLLAPNADWRWLLDRQDSPWYPSMRLFRRGFGEARAAQVARVGQALRESA